MSSALLTSPVVSRPARVVRAAPKPKRWTCEEFHRLGEAGFFEQSRVMLIDGEILEMPVANPPHATSKSLVEAALRVPFANGFAIRTDNPLMLGRSIDPIPDVAVVVGTIRDYATTHPTTAQLVVEIGDSTVDYDMDEKASLYASAGIADYWVVDLVNRRLVVFRDPQADSTQAHGFAYANETSYLPNQSVSPLAAQGSSVAVADLLP